mmetsp:Transcript_982/g.2685  ORF Transcript_982/g.2685 Transcript_982/m.2685 type:complete len:367 (+) Transcript_982:658-1758(+)
MLGGGAAGAGGASAATATVPVATLRPGLPDLAFSSWMVVSTRAARFRGGVCARAAGAGSCSATPTGGGDLGLRPRLLPPGGGSCAAAGPGSSRGSSPRRMRKMLTSRTAELPRAAARSDTASSSSLMPPAMSLSALWAPPLALPVLLSTSGLSASRLSSSEVPSPSPLPIASSMLPSSDSTGCADSIDMLTAAYTASTSASLQPSSATSSCLVGARPRPSAITRRVLHSLLTRSITLLGSLMSAACVRMARPSACRIHMCAYVDSLQPEAGSYFSTARMKPWMPSPTRSCTPMCTVLPARLRAALSDRSTISPMLRPTSSCLEDMPTRSRPSSVLTSVFMALASSPSVASRRSAASRRLRACRMPR